MRDGSTSPPAEERGFWVPPSSRWLRRANRRHEPLYTLVAALRRAHDRGARAAATRTDLQDNSRAGKLAALPK
jgi:hypothetical protein